jgi:hypothetical protein
MVHKGDTFTTEVFLDTGGQDINAIEGTITVPPQLEFTDIRYQGSVVSLWLTEPKERIPGLIDFAGVIPAGYEASPEKTGRGNIFTLVFRAKKVGTALITFGAGGKFYLNDGQGTAASFAFSPATVDVMESNGTPSMANIKADTTPPESFTPVVTSGEPYGISGMVLVFGTIDKDSGIAKYQIAHSYSGFVIEPFLSWRDVESPYTFQGSDTGEYIFVRALDRSGNQRIVVVLPQQFNAITFFATWVIPLLLLLGIVFLVSRFSRKPPKTF